MTFQQSYHTAIYLNYVVLKIQPNKPGSLLAMCTFCFDRLKSNFVILSPYLLSFWMKSDASVI